MVSNLPWLENDQTLYSWCARVHAANGASGALATSRELFGAPYAALCHDFPSRLAYLTSHFPEAELGEVELALRHTLLGYFLVLMPRRAAYCLLASVIKGSVPSIKMRLGITASRVGGHHPLKGCDACIIEDLNRVGFAYWHIEHQFPSVMACTSHKRPLFIAWDPVTPVHRRGWLLPVGGLGWERIDVPVRDDHQLHQLHRLAEFSTKFASCAPATFDAKQLAKCYQLGLRSHGFVTAMGSLRLKTLVDEMRIRYTGLEDLMGFEALKAVTPDWPGLLGSVARTVPRRVHPLKHLLMIALVFDSWKDFLVSYEAAGSQSEEAVEPEVAPSPADPMEKLVQLLKRDGMSVSAAARELGITTTTATQIARRAGIHFTLRRKLLKGPRLQQIRRLLRRGWPSKRVSKATGTSVVSINRLLAADPDLKQAWQTAAFLARRKVVRNSFLTLVQRCPNATVKELRRVRGGDYTWLYRHDREWLRSAIPALWTKWTRPATRQKCGSGLSGIRARDAAD